MPSNLQVIAHPPERGRRSTTLAAAGSCCCCCCCLHAVGGLAGAIVGGVKKVERPVPDGIPAQEAGRIHLEVKSAEQYAVRVYWMSLLIIALIACLVVGMEQNHDQLVVMFFVIALGLPFGQLGASVAALIYLNVFPHPRKSDSLRRLGRITLYAFVGGLIGTGVMAAAIPMFK
jgi:hypothetical protein